MGHTLTFGQQVRIAGHSILRKQNLIINLWLLLTLLWIGLMRGSGADIAGSWQLWFWIAMCSLPLSLLPTTMTMDPAAVRTLGTTTGDIRRINAITAGMAFAVAQVVAWCLAVFLFGCDEHGTHLFIPLVFFGSLVSLTYEVARVTPVHSEVTALNTSADKRKKKNRRQMAKLEKSTVLDNSDVASVLVIAPLRGLTRHALGLGAAAVGLIVVLGVCEVMQWEQLLPGVIGGGFVAGLAMVALGISQSLSRWLVVSGSRRAWIRLATPMLVSRGALIAALFPLGLVVAWSSARYVGISGGQISDSGVTLAGLSASVVGAVAICVYLLTFSLSAAGVSVIVAANQLTRSTLGQIGIWILGAGLGGAVIAPMVILFKRVQPAAGAQDLVADSTLVGVIAGLVLGAWLLTAAAGWMVVRRAEVGAGIQANLGIDNAN